MPRLYCIDASIYIFRAYFSYPDRWFSPEGYSLNAVYGYWQFLLDFLQQARPDNVMVAYDESLGSCFRHELYEDYKCNRVLPDEALAFQLEACRALTEAMGLASYAHQRYEADDLIATSSRLARESGCRVTVVSRDKDLAQVLHHEDDIWWNLGDKQKLPKSEWEAVNGLRSDQVADWLALKGDAIDSIPGVPGVGDVTAKRLLERFNSIDELYRRLGEVPDSGLRGAAGLALKLADHEDQVRLSRQLAELCEDIEDLGSLEDFSYRPGELEPVRELLLGLGFEPGLVTNRLKRLQLAGVTS